MDGADTCARQHGVSGLENHRQIKTDSIAVFNPAFAQQLAQSAYYQLQLPVGNQLILRRVVSFTDDGYLVRTLGQMTVDAVDTDIQLAALEPGDFALMQIALAHPVPFSVPGEKGLGLLGPKSIGIVHGLLVQHLIAFFINSRVAFEMFGYGIDWMLGHWPTALLLT